MKTIVKVEWSGREGLWDVRDDSGRIRQKIPAQQLPARVLEAAAVARRAYFHVEVRGKELAFGNRAIGDPGLI